MKTIHQGVQATGNRIVCKKKGKIQTKTENKPIKLNSNMQFTMGH